MYKVWVQIEEVDEEGDAVDGHGETGVLPDCIGEFERLSDAMVRQADCAIRWCGDPTNSDAVNHIKEQREKEAAGEPKS